MYAKRTVIFVSEMYLSLRQRSSTHIMIDNIITGMLEAGYEILFIAISNKNEKKAIIDKYEKLGIRVVFWETQISREVSNKYLNLWNNYVNIVKGIAIPRNVREELENFRNENTVLLSHSPSVESVHICKKIKKGLRIRYIQYWSDPISLGGILPEQFGIKRVPFWIIENNALGSADEIVYGTRSLMIHQKKLFTKHSARMRWVKVAYTKKKATEHISKNNKIIVLYSGNYYSSIRNIEPLYEAMRQVGSKFQLYVYGRGDCNLNDTDNVEIHDRIDYEQMQVIEANADIQICILNRSCIQIPGKVFYNTDLDQNILVLLDGKYKNDIQKELEEYCRFDFCENNTKSIVEFLNGYSILENGMRNKNNNEALSAKNVAIEILQTASTK